MILSECLGSTAPSSHPQSAEAGAGLTLLCGLVDLNHIPVYWVSPSVTKGTLVGSQQGWEGSWQGSGPVYCTAEGDWGSEAGPLPGSSHLEWQRGAPAFCLLLLFCSLFRQVDQSTWTPFLPCW